MVVSDQNEQHQCHGTDTTETDGSCRSKCFDNFVQAQTCHQTFSTFHALCQAIDIEYPPAQSSCDHITFYPRLKKQLGDSWRAQSLWGKLDKRFYGKEYFFNSKMNRPGGTRIGEDTKILIIGAGPCGLRTAIEMACLGAKTIVVEKRDVFSRNNVLHLWPFIITDLKALGAKKFYGRFCAGAIDHISIRQLQLILLKTSLLLGVEVVVNVLFESLSIPSDPVICDDGTVHQKGWTASVKPSDHPLAKYEFDVIVGADGKRNTLQGFKRKEFRGKLAIGLTANFINRNTSAEAKVEEISGVAYIFNQEFFKNLCRTTHIDLENIVYYKGETHYFVMTAKKHSLIAKGVLRQDYDDTKSLLCYQNVNQEALTLYAREAANFSTNHKLPNLEFAINQYGQADVALFDFTCMYAAENAGLFREIKGQKLLSSLVGDSLLEPFWPMGTGCARGFFAAFDLVWMTRRWCLLTQSSNDNHTAVEKGNSIELEVLAERESIYRLLHHTTPQNTVKKWANYTIDPNTRYPNLNTKMVSTKQVAPLYLSDQHHGDEAQEQEKTSNQNGPATSHAESRRPLNSALTRKVSIVRSNKLMTWCRRITENYEAVHITDMSSSWRSGLALCAIIHQFRPDLVKWEELHPIDIEVNNQLAFDLAEKHFGISPVMTGKEMATCDEVDKLVMVTYISQFYEVFKNEKPVGVVAIKNGGNYLETPGAQEGPKSPLSSTSPVGLLIRFTNHIKRKSVNGKHEEQVKKKKYGGLFRRKSSSSAPEAIPEDENKENESKDDAKAQSSVMKIGGSEVRLRPKKGAQSQEGSVRVPGVNQRASDRISALSSQLMSQFVQNGALREMPASDKCYFCQKRVYIAERMSAESLFFHSKCFVCCHCGITLRRGNYEYVSETGKFYCRAHYFSHSDMFKQAGSKGGQKKYSVDYMDSASTNAPGLIDTLRHEEVKPTEKFLTPERIELANIRMSMLSHPEELSEEAQTQHNLSGLQQGRNSPIQEDDFMSESSDEDVDWEAVLKEANEQGRNDPDESDLDTDEERADDSLISQSSSRGCNDVTAVSWLNDTCLADESMTNEQLLDDQRTLSDMSDCEENLEELTNGHHSVVCNGNNKPPFECKRCRHMRLKSDPEIKALPKKADSVDESDSDSSDDSMSDSSVATVDFGTDEASSFFPIATPRNSLKPPKPTTLPRSKRPSAMSLPSDDKAFGETFQGIGVISEILKSSRDNEEEPQECLFLSLAEMEVERQRLCSLPPKPAKCPVVYMPKQELAKLTNASAKDPSTHEAIQKWLLSSVDVPGMREPQQNGRQPVELYSTSIASSLEGSDNDQVKTRRSLSSSSSAADSLIDPDPAAKYGELNSQTAPVVMETVGTGFFSPEKSNVNVAEVETEQKAKEDDVEDKLDELSSLSTASPSNIPDVPMSEHDSDDETPARVEPEVGEELKDPPEISAESRTGEKASSDVPSAPPARKPRTIFNLLSSPVEPEQPALSFATLHQEETASGEVSELELPKRVRSSNDMRRLDTLDRVQQYLLQNPMDIEHERSQDEEDDALSTASSATSTSDLNTAQFDVEDLLEDNSNNKSSHPPSASVVARSAAIGSATNATSLNQARPLPRPVSTQGVHVAASASTARNNTSVWSNLADDTTSSEVELPSGGDRGKSFSESYISSYRPGQESWSDEHERRPKPPAPERRTSYDSLELRMKMRLKARNQWFQQELDQAMQLQRATSENSDQDEERVSSERCEAPSSPAGASWQTASDIELVGEPSLLAYTPATPSAPLAASLDSDNDQFFTPIAKTPVRPQQDKDISTPLSVRSPPQLGNLTMSTTHDTTGDFVSPQGTPSTVPRRLPSVPSTTNRRSLPALPTVPHLEALSPTWQSPQTKPSVEEELRTREMRVKERVAKMKAQTAKKRNSMSSKSESNRTSSSFDDAEVVVGKKSQSSASDDVTSAANPTGQVEPIYSGVSPKPKRRTSFRQKLRKMHKRKEESNDPSSKVKRTLPVPNAVPQRTGESASPVEMVHGDADKKKKKKIKIKKTKDKTVSSRRESSADSGDRRKSSPGKSAKVLFRMSPRKKDRKLVGNSTFYDGESTLERKYKTDSDRERAILRGERVRFLPDVPDSANTSRDRQDSYDSIEKDATHTKQPRRKRRSTLAGYTPEQIEAKITRRVQIAARRQAKMEAQKRLRRAQVIQRQLEEVEVKQRELEERGVSLEKLLREEGERKSREESASMQEWFQLVQEKNALLRYENELMIYQRELQLEDVQSHLQQELRERMAMEDKRKTSAQLAQEKEILQKMLEVVEQRDELVGLLEEQRIKEKVEMVDIETLMLSKFNTFSNQDQSADASSDSVTSSPLSAPVSS